MPIIGIKKPNNARIGIVYRAPAIPTTTSPSRREREINIPTVTPRAIAMQLDQTTSRIWVLSAEKTNIFLQNKNVPCINKNYHKCTPPPSLYGVISAAHASKETIPKKISSSFTTGSQEPPFQSMFSIALLTEELEGKVVAKETFSSLIRPCESKSFRFR